MSREEIREAIRILRGAVARLQVHDIDRAYAAQLLAEFAECERLSSTGTALVAGKVADVELVARTTGTTVGKARAVVGLSDRMKDTPVLTDAMREGSLSLDQATEIAKAETAAPGSAEGLVEVAAEAPLHVLRERSRAAVLSTQRVSLGARQRAARRASHRITDLGMVHIEADLEPHIGKPIIDRIEAAARRRGASSDESWERRMADAFGEVCSSGTSRRSKPELVVLVSHEVATRGWTAVEDGERCEIPGVGPIDPGVAREIAKDAFLSGVFFDGTDLRQMKRWTRSIPVEVKVALELGAPPAFDGRRCVDCGNRFGLEHDHDIPFAAGGATSLGNLPDRCERCHRKKTRRDRVAIKAQRSKQLVGAGRERDPP